MVAAQAGQSAPSRQSGRPPFEGPLVRVDGVIRQPLMTPFPGPVVGLRPKPSHGPHHGPGVGRVRATIIGQGTVSDCAGATAIALNGQNVDPAPVLHRTRRGAVPHEDRIGIGRARRTGPAIAPENDIVNAINSHRSPDLTEGRPLTLKPSVLFFLTTLMVLKNPPKGGDSNPTHWSNACQNELAKTHKRANRFPAPVDHQQG